jgi:uncharacterized repeat protein (TIGR03803 family)
MTRMAKQATLGQFGKMTFVALAWALLLGAIAPQSARAQTFKTLYQFTEQDQGSSPDSPLVLDSAGNLYGTAGSNANGDGNGAVFEFNPGSGGITFLYTFPGTGGNGENGAQPQGVVFGADGNLYGQTFDGGYNGYGLIYKLTLGSQFTILHNFQGPPNDGVYPLGNASLFLAPSGLFYGVTFEGGNGACGLYYPKGYCGIAFQVDSSGNESVIYNFQQSPDGFAPPGGLIQDTRGNLYGVTFGGGANPGAVCGGLGNDYGENCGSVFKLSPSSGGGWTESTVYSFKGGADGATPSQSPLTMDAQGNIYGTAVFHGSPQCLGGCGTLYKIDTSGNFTVLHSFTGGNDGDHPQFVTSDAAGNLYVAAEGGDPSCSVGCGLVVKLDTGGEYKVVHKFNGKDGADPSSLSLDASTGIIYGTTPLGGLCSFCGTIFEITP